MIVGHSYRVRISTSSTDSSWIPGAMLAQFPNADVVSISNVGAGKVDVYARWRSAGMDIQPGATLRSQLPGFPGELPSGVVTEVEDLGKSAELIPKLSFWPMVGAAAVMGLVVVLSMRVRA